MEPAGLEGVPRHRFGPGALSVEMSGSGRTPLVDRLVAATGGRALVAGAPGLGWLAVEVIPAFVWTQITGALSMEFFYFVTFLGALGVPATRMPALTVAAMAASIAMGLLVLRRPATDPRRRCVIDTVIGRGLWLGTVLAPLAAWRLGLGPGWILVLALVFVFLAQLVHAAGGASFVTWTQAVVPPERRGLFYGWRNLASYLVVALTLLAAGRLLPRESALASGPGPLAALLLGATAVGLLGVWLLARAPGMPAAAHLARYAPLRPQLAGNRPFRRFLAWSMLINLSLALSPAMQPALYHRAGVASAAMATWQATVYYPAMLAGIVWTVRALPRTGARRQLLIAHLALLLGEAALLPLSPARLAWLMPLAQGCIGMARGMWSVAWISRLQEIIPPGDPRFAAVAVAAGAAVGLVASLLALVLGPALAGWLGGHAGWPDLAWTLVAAGVAARVVATPFLLRGDKAPA
jgi:hypothetical protein